MTDQMQRAGKEKVKSKERQKANTINKKEMKRVKENVPVPKMYSMRAHVVFTCLHF